MKTAGIKLRNVLLSAAIALPFVMAMTATNAEAGERAHKAMRNGASGQQMQGMRNRSLQDGHYESHSTRTGPNGKTATRDTVGDYDADAGKWTRDTNSVGPNGKTSSTHAEVQKTDSGYTRDASHIGPKGGETTSHTDFVRTDNGYQRDKTITGPNGKTTTAETTMTRTDDGYVREKTVTKPNGNTSTTEVTRTFTPKQ